MITLGFANVHADTIDNDEGDNGGEAKPSVGCQQPHAKPLDSELGSVGFMKNIAEHPESIRAVAKRLLTKAVAATESGEQPQCHAVCVGALRSEVVYRVEPTVFVAESEQQAMCLTLEDQTKLKPLHFGERDFASIEKLNDWLMEFSQGRGEDGKSLYAQCGGNCSPRYTFRIAQNDGKLHVNADVLCGQARDKTSDLYAVSTAIEWRCSAN